MVFFAVNEFETFSFFLQIRLRTINLLNPEFMATSYYLLSATADESVVEFICDHPLPTLEFGKEEKREGKCCSQSQMFRIEGPSFVRTAEGVNWLAELKA